jgi:hypothetical protein
MGIPPSFGVSVLHFILIGPVLSAAFAGLAPGQAPSADASATSSVPDVSADIIGCGKGQAVVQQYLRAHAPDVPADMPEAGTDSLTDTDVLHNDLTVEVFPSTASLTGTNVFTIKSQSANLNSFTFRLRNQFTITSALVNGTIPVNVQQVGVTTRVATLDHTYGMDEVFTLAISYTGVPVSLGFGSITYTTHNGANIVCTLSEPYYAYTWWPAKDGDVAMEGDNSDKATFDIWIIAPDTLTSISNGLLQAVDVLPNNRKRYHWHTDYPMTTYLACFSTTNYNHWSATYNYDGGSMPVEFYIWPENDTLANRTAWEVCLTALDVFGSLYGLYPFTSEKYGMYQFTFGGGQEHQTMTGIGGFWEYVVVHELSHQWWGDMITCKTWHDIWLNEGFATYSEALWYEHKPGSAGLPDLFAAMAARRPSNVSGTVYVQDSDLGNLGAIFSTNNVYRKGAWVLHQLRHVVSDATFYNILAAYRAAYQYGAAITADFQGVCESVYGADLDWFFNEWVYGPGAPAYEYGFTSVFVGGQRYLLLYINQTQQSSWGTFTMPVDIRINYSGGTMETRTVWNNADPQWFVLPVPAQPTAVTLDEFDWILDTSKTFVAYVNGPPSLVQAVPAPGVNFNVLSPPATLIARFSTNVNAPASAFTVTGDVTGPRPFTLSYSSAQQTATLTFTQSLQPDRYTVQIAPTVISLLSGMALDGEIVNGVLPSGNGVPGGAAVYEFHVAQRGDADADLDIDLTDYAALAGCLGDPGVALAPPSCAVFDFDTDNDVDLRDAAAFANAFHP